MRQPTFTNRVQTSFAVPPDAPASVEDAWSKFSALSDRYADASSALKQTPRAIADAEAADTAANATDYAAGLEPKDANKRLRKAEAEGAARQAEVAGLLSALDTAGDELARAIDQARDEWLVTASETLEADHAAYLEAVQAARSAAARLAQNRGLVRWLRAWRLVTGSGGIVVNDIDMKYVGPGKLTVDTTTIPRESETSLVDVLALAATVTPEEAAPPTSRRHRVAAR